MRSYDRTGVRVEQHRLRENVEVTPAKLYALRSCLLAGQLVKSNGYWLGSSQRGRQPITGGVVADLCRDGLLRKVERTKKDARAYLTDDGREIVLRTSEAAETAVG